MSAFKSILFLFLLLPVFISFGMENLFDGYNWVVRNEVEARIEKFKQTGDKSFLNDPFHKDKLDLDVYTDFFLINPLSALTQTKFIHSESNSDLIQELLNQGATVTGASVFDALSVQDYLTLETLLRHNASREIVNLALLGRSYLGKDNAQGMKLLLSYGAQPNITDMKNETILFDLIRLGIKHYKNFEEGIANCGQAYKLTKVAQLELRNLTTCLEMVKLVLEYGVNPYIKNAEGQTVFDLIGECNVSEMKSISNPNESVSQETKKEFDGLAQLLKQSVDKRINRMTDFLHTRASQTPFKVAEIAHKIAEHLYKDDMEIAKQDWDKLSALIKK